MKHSLSTFGRRLAMDSGIGELMQDLGEVLASGDEGICMLGGGQPAHLPAVDRWWHERLQAIASDPGQVASVLGDYQPPGGDASFREAVAQLFRREYGWPIDGGNVCITAGGQTALFLLMNAMAGRFDDGTFKKILLPIVPEYIGYADQSTSTDLFHAVRPTIEMTGPHEFKYHIDFESLEIDDSVAAICLSRPTNPSANVIGNDELTRLAEIAVEKKCPADRRQCLWRSIPWSDLYRHNADLESVHGVDVQFVQTGSAWNPNRYRDRRPADRWVPVIDECHHIFGKQ